MEKVTDKFTLTAITYSYTESKETSLNPPEATKSGIRDAQVTCRSCGKGEDWNDMKFAGQACGFFKLECFCGASEDIPYWSLM